MSPKPSHKQVNTVLSGVLILLALYILVYPFVPAAKWWLRYEAPLASGAPSSVVVDKAVNPEVFKVLAPSIGLEQVVHEGPTTATLNKGVWHIPGSSQPGQNGNVIMAGHRFTYSGQSVFYNLDKIKYGDNITVFKDSARYDYRVDKISVVAPSDETLVAPTVDKTLTMYTCTPLWSAKNRLVITAKQVSP